MWQRLGVILYHLARPVMVLYLPRTTRTRLLIVCGGELLVTRTWISDGRWSLPGGGLHGGEEPVTGILRETHEEIGVSLQPADVRLTAEGEYNDRGLRFKCHYFVVELIEKPHLKLRRFEISDSRWVTLGEIQADKYGPDVIAAIQAYRGS